MNHTETSPSFWERNKVLNKGFLVAILILLMLIPGMFVSNLVTERQKRQESVVSEVSSKWAGQQTIVGPILMLPYKDYYKGTDGIVRETKKTAFILPDELHVNGSMDPQEKKRSLYSVMLYRSKLQLTGKFNMLPLQALQIPPDLVLWNEARLAITMGDLRGIEDQVHLDWNGAKLMLDAGIPENNLLKSGLSIPVAVNAQDQYTFSLNLNVRGSGLLYFTPVGKTTDVTLSANWKDPAFDGQYLPSTSTVTDKNFTASWKILPLSRSFPQAWRENGKNLAESAFGVRLIQPVDGYAKTFRSVKYAILFIALTFVCFFFLEIMQKRQVHPLQYLLVGFALIIFYTLLLSISEYAGFNIAYLIASLATVSLITLYASSIFKSGKTALGFGISLAGLYGYIFILIQSEDYALLFGSIGLFIIIAIIMYYSRKIDWYGVSRPHTGAPSL
ncbi:MAG: cell envelope integrity protein CreD [Bacteroidota bacterium]